MVSKDLCTHFDHLRSVLNVLLANQLYAKTSRCVFGCVEVEYLGHLNFGQRVRTDPKNSFH